MSRIVAFGCSNTYGQGLRDCYIKPNSAAPAPSNNAWPALLAQRFEYNCLNLSRLGASNKEIWIRLMNTTLYETDIVVINWTYPERWCVFKSDLWEAEGNEVHRIGLWLNDKTSKVFYSKIYNEDDINLELNLQMHHAKLYLDSIGVKNYHAVMIHNDIKKLPWNTTSLIESEFSSIMSKYPRAFDKTHPGPAAHREYARKLYKEIKDQL